MMCQVHQRRRSRNDFVSYESTMATTTTTTPKARMTRQYPMGNHLWVNTERIQTNRRPLNRNRTLDEMARRHAEHMATSCELVSCTITLTSTTCDNDGDDTATAFTTTSPIETLLTSSNGRRIQQTCLRGPSIHIVHQLTMESASEAKEHILNPNYKEFGMGAVKSSKDQQIYICQLFC